MSMDRTAVARVLEQIAAHLEFQEENPFRIRAFRTAAKAIRGLPVEPAVALGDGTLKATRGIGPATLSIVKELIETPSSASKPWRISRPRHATGGSAVSRGSVPRRWRVCSKASP
jgi:DNA polymerase/3'-5' exonuclease PolX